MLPRIPDQGKEQEARRHRKRDSDFAHDALAALPLDFGGARSLVSLAVEHLLKACFQAVGGRDRQVWHKTLDAQQFPLPIAAGSTLLQMLGHSARWASGARAG